MPFLLTCLLAVQVVLTWSKSLDRNPAEPCRNLREPKQRARCEYGEAVAKIDFNAVRADIRELLTDSQAFWPADFDNYGPFFVRLAWHCAGTYRLSDGRGGCEGGLQRFEPEQSWGDNTNLDKARTLLLPIKLKHGKGLSWGDLLILAGNTAIESMGGPLLGFCGGRMDDDSGAESEPLGPSAIQERLYPCKVNGTCKWPLGASTVGLIYVNPEGPMGQPIPESSVYEIRDVFSRMGMNVSETVALIGGGHAFGKSHGACPLGAGPPPKEDPFNPWPGLCGTGKGNDTFTSGIELQWTPNPTKWDNDYFKLLHENDWDKFRGPGDHWQWKSQSHRRGASEKYAKIGMLTSDIALKHDPEFTKFVKLWARDLKSLDHAFSHAWYKLTTRDMGPVTRCVGDSVPPAQPFQNPLPAPRTPLPNFDLVKADIKKLLHTSNDKIMPADQYFGKPYYGGLFMHLAMQCAFTYRETDHAGGCNGARLRFSPEKDWPANVDMDKALLLLSPIKDRFRGISWADLIVLAGNVAVEDAGGKSITFCGGRVDAEDGDALTYLEPNISSATEDPYVFKNEMRIKGLSIREWVVLIGGGHSVGKMHINRSGFTGSRTDKPTQLSNEFFKNLFAEQWEVFTNSLGKKQYKARGKELYMLKSDLVLKVDPEFANVAQEYASDNSLFLTEFSEAWSRMMNVDRFDGPTGNICDSVSRQSMEDIDGFTAESSFSTLSPCTLAKGFAC